MNLVRIKDKKSRKKTIKKKANNKEAQDNESIEQAKQTQKKIRTKSLSLRIEEKERMKVLRMRKGKN